MSSLPSIDLDPLVSRLVQLLRTPSPTGDTEDALALVVRWLREMGQAPRLTRKGAVTVTLPGRANAAPRAVTGHVDTLGAIVTQIKPNGRLAFGRIGGYPLFAVNGEYCWVMTADGRTHTVHRRKSTICCPSYPMPSRTERQSESNASLAQSQPNMISAQQSSEDIDDSIPGRTAQHCC